MDPRHSQEHFESGETSLQMRQALDGNLESLEWTIVRLSPILVLEARERLGPYLRKLYEAEDSSKKLG